MNTSTTAIVAALRLPVLPAYHRPHMDLEAIIDRGDVWYDFPFTPSGAPRNQPIVRRPRLTLYVQHRGRRLPGGVRRMRPICHLSRSPTSGAHVAL